MGQINLNKRAILITGTIIPNSNFVAHTNAIERKQEYIDGLLFYATEFPKDDIYFLENSAFNFENDIVFQKIFKEKNISLMKFSESSHYNEGKGYQEFEMLDRCIEKLASKYDEFIKITGRYKVLNLKKITNSNCEYMIADSHQKFKVTQTNVFQVTTKFYHEHLKGLYLNVNDAEGRFIEHVIYSQLILKNILNKVYLFNENPIITGLSGSYAGTLNRNKYKMMMRNIERRILKTLGIHQFTIEY